MNRICGNLTAVIASLSIFGCGGEGGNTEATTTVPKASTRLAANAVVQITDYRPIVQQLYIAYFGRPADPAGEDNFTNILAWIGLPADIQQLNAAYATNKNVRTLVDSFGNSQESFDLYGKSDATSFVKAIYTNVLGRLPDAKGLGFWIEAIERGELTKGNAALSIVAGALSNTSTQGLRDGLLIKKRVSVAQEFTSILRAHDQQSVYSGNHAAATARALLHGVFPFTPPNEARSKIDGAIAALIASPDNTELRSFPLQAAYQKLLASNELIDGALTIEDYFAEQITQKCFGDWLDTTERIPEVQTFEWAPSYLVVNKFTYKTTDRVCGRSGTQTTNLYIDSYSSLLGYWVREGDSSDTGYMVTGIPSAQMPVSAKIGDAGILTGHSPIYYNSTKRSLYHYINYRFLIERDGNSTSTAILNLMSQELETWEYEPLRVIERRYRIDQSGALSFISLKRASVYGGSPTTIYTITPR